MGLPLGSPRLTNRQSRIPSAWSTLRACPLILKSNPVGMLVLLRWHDRLRSRESARCSSEVCANPAMQKIAWEISWDGVEGSMTAQPPTHNVKNKNADDQPKL